MEGRLQGEGYTKVKFETGTDVSFDSGVSFSPE
jgi:hypothetical protein